MTPVLDADAGADAAVAADAPDAEAKSSTRSGGGSRRSATNGRAVAAAAGLDASDLAAAADDDVRIFVSAQLSHAMLSVQNRGVSS